MIETTSPGLHGTNHTEIAMKCRLGQIKILNKEYLRWTPFIKDIVHYGFFSLPFYFLLLYKPLTSSEFKWFSVQTSPMWTSSPYCTVEINLFSVIWTCCTSGETEQLLYRSEKHWKQNDLFFKQNPMQTTYYMYTMWKE